VLLTVGLGVALVAGGCGYRFGAGGRTFAPEVRTIGITDLVNKTREVGIEKRLALAIEREFSMRGPLKVVNDPLQGDLILTGSVGEVQDRPTAFNREDEVLMYQTTLALDLTLRRRDGGEVVWQAHGLRAASDYESVASVIVTTSSEFRRTTLNPEDLGAFTDVQLAESRRRQAVERMAVERIVASLARDVYQQVMEDF
jgi:hypothetical protein